MKPTQQEEFDDTATKIFCGLLTVLPFTVVGGFIFEWMWDLSVAIFITMLAVLGVIVLYWGYQMFKK